MNVYTCTNFSGPYPAKTAAVIVAENRVRAKEVLLDHLALMGWPQSKQQKSVIEVIALPTGHEGMRILNEDDL